MQSIKNIMSQFREKSLSPIEIRLYLAFLGTVDVIGYFKTKFSAEFKSN